MAERNPFDQFDETQPNPFDQFDAAQGNPFDQFDGPAQPPTSAAAASPPRTPQQPPSPVGPLPTAKDPWAGVNVDDLRRNAGMAVPVTPPPDNRPLMDRAVEAYQNAPREAPKGGNPLTDFMPEYAKDIQQSTDTLSTGVNRLAKAPGILSQEALQGGLETALGGLGYVMSPVTAAATALVGNPVERTTGIPAPYGDTVALTVTPGVGVKPIVTKTTREMVAATPQARRAVEGAKPAVAEAPPVAAPEAPPVAPEASAAAPLAKTEPPRVEVSGGGTSKENPQAIKDVKMLHGLRVLGREWDSPVAVSELPQNVARSSGAAQANAVVLDLAKKLGLDGKISVMVADAADKSSRSGVRAEFIPLKGSDVFTAALRPNESADSGVIILNRAKNPEELLGVAIHELGHAVEQLTLLAQPQHVKNAVAQAWKQQKNSVRVAGAAANTVRQLRPITNPKDTPLSHLGDSQQKYLLSYNEWVAEQASRWITTDKRPVTVVDRYFKGIADRWKRLYELAVGHQPLADEIKTFMNGQWRDDIELTRHNISPIDVDPTTGAFVWRGGVAGANSGQATASAPGQQPLDNQPPSGGQPPPPPPGGQPPPPPPGGQPPRGTPLGQAPAAQNIPPAARYDNPIQAAAQTIEKVFSPSTVDDKSRAAANAFRQELGIAARENDIMAAALKKERDLIDTADQGTRNAFINYVEGRSAGAANPFPALQPLADTWRNIAQKFETQAIPRIDRLTGMNFVQDYFPHLWKDPNAAAQWFEMSGQGRGGFTKKRTLQLYADGLAAGLEPKYPNPVDAMEAYIVNANKYLAHERIFQFGKKNGYIKYLTPKAAGRVAQRLNLVPLKGRLGKSMGGPVSYTAYAPENFARVYNNMVDKGWTGAAGDLTRGLRQSANQITALELGLSGFHALTTAAESTIGRMANAVTAVSRGRPITAMSEMAKAPLAPVLDAVKGAALRSEYKAPGTGSPMVQRITDILTRAGARPGKQDEIHFASDRRGYLQGGFDATKALAKGRIGEAFDRMGQAIATTGRDLKDDITSGFQVPGDYGRRNTSSAVAQTVSNVFKVTGNVLDTVMAPLFKVVVPTLKNGAMYRMVENFIQAYPNATDAEILEYARRVVDSVDNRFGEMVTENIAYPRYVKEGAQVALRSGSYAYGQIARELGGGAADFLSMPFRKGGIATPLWTEKMSYLIAMPIVSGAAAATTMYLMTGKWPSELMDLYKPKSGGQTEDGDPERVNMPGMMKEIIEPFSAAAKNDWRKAMDHYWGKTSTFISTTGEVLTGQDWKREKIAYTDAERAAHPRGDEFDPYFLAWAKHIFGKLVPITVRNLAEGQPPGSAITPAMTAFGFQRASKSASNPDKADQFKAYRTKKEMDKKLKEKDRKEQWR